MNVSKTKEMCIDFKKNQRCPKRVCIKEEAVERVETYKYLSVVFDSKLLGAEESEFENVLLEKAEIFWSQFRFVSNILLRCNM